MLDESCLVFNIAALCIYSLLNAFVNIAAHTGWWGGVKAGEGD